MSNTIAQAGSDTIVLWQETEEGMVERAVYLRAYANCIAIGQEKAEIILDPAAVRAFIRALRLAEDLRKAMERKELKQQEEKK